MKGNGLMGLLSKLNFAEYEYELKFPSTGWVPLHIQIGLIGIVNLNLQFWCNPPHPLRLVTGRKSQLFETQPTIIIKKFLVGNFSPIKIEVYGEEGEVVKVKIKHLSEK